jgi:hypothetical protein
MMVRIPDITECQPKYNHDREETRHPPVSTHNQRRSEHQTSLSVNTFMEWTTDITECQFAIMVVWTPDITECHTVNLKLWYWRHITHDIQTSQSGVPTHNNYGVNTWHHRVSTHLGSEYQTSRNVNIQAWWSGHQASPSVNVRSWLCSEHQTLVTDDT